MGCLGLWPIDDCDAWFVHLRAHGLLYVCQHVDTGTDDPELFLEEFYVVGNRYACAAHLFWGYWAIIQARTLTFGRSVDPPDS